MAEGKIASGTQVRREKIGKWILAYRVKGLLDRKPTDSSNIDDQKEVVKAKKGEYKAKANAADKSELTAALAESRDQVKGVFRRKRLLIFYPGVVFPKSCIWTGTPVVRLRAVKIQEIKREPAELPL